MKKIFLFGGGLLLLTHNLFALADMEALTSRLESKVQSVQKNTESERVAGWKQKVLGNLAECKKRFAYNHEYSLDEIYQSAVNLRNAYMTLRRLDVETAREVAPFVNTIRDNNFAALVEKYCETLPEEYEYFNKFQKVLVEDLSSASVKSKVLAHLSLLSEKNPFATDIKSVGQAYSILLETAENKTDDFWEQTLLYKVELFNEELAKLKLKNYSLYQDIYKVCNHSYGSMKNLRELELTAEKSLNGRGMVHTIAYYEAKSIRERAPEKEFSNVTREMVISEFETFKKLAYNLDYTSYEAMFTAMRNLRNSYMSLHRKNIVPMKDLAKIVNTKINIAGGSHQIQVEAYIRMESGKLYNKSEHSQLAMREGHKERNLFDSFQGALKLDLKK